MVVLTERPTIHYKDTSVSHTPGSDPTSGPPPPGVSSEPLRNGVIIMAVTPTKQAGDMAVDVGDRFSVWVFLVGRSVDSGSGPNRSWRDPDPTTSARQHPDEGYRWGDIA